MSRLAEYRRRRNFSATPEPASKPASQATSSSRRPRGRKAERLGYVIQLHHARSRHFDFRLELGGTLRSWAIPKGPSLDPAEKRLAVEVEDHPLAYADFEGDIPAGHYGAGHVDLWDRGEWTPDGDAEAGLKKGHLAFELFGARLKGRWDLIRTRYSGRQPNWLLVKHDDAHVRAGDVADDRPLRELAPPVRTPSAARRKKSKVKLPVKIGLQLARLEARAPAGAAWLHEVKYDGYRALLSRSGKTVRITSRNGLDWTAQLPALAKALRALPCRECVLDSELVVIDAQGRSRFDLLQTRFADARENDLLAMTFDLLFLDGDDLRGESQIARKQMLATLLAKAKAPLQCVEYLEGDGPTAAAEACRAGLEGIVSKARDAPYEEGRGGHWLKIKCVDAGEFAVVGYTPGKGARARLGSLLLAEPGRDKSSWRYVGRVGSGLDEARIDLLLKKLKPLKKPLNKTAEKPAALQSPPTRADLLGAQPVWVKPGAVVEVEHRGWTGERRLRQASLKGLRIDRSPQSLRKPDAAPRVTPVAATPQSRDRGNDERSGAASYAFTHPERLLFAKPAISKQDVGDYYRRVAPLMLPELIRRPLSLIRCPDGAEGKCFFQKHVSPGFRDAIRELPIAGNHGDVQNYFYVEDLEGLLDVVQMSAIELHPWGSRIDTLEQPDRLVFDLDPAPEVAWKRVIAAARLLRERLAALKLESFVRTSGGKGLHVVVPLLPEAEWETAKAFTQAMAQTLAEEFPAEFVATATKAKREGRIFIDYLRNGRGATSVASYSLRARTGAPIAVPLAWDELARIKSGAQYDFGNIRRRLAKLGGEDAWAGIESVRQRLPGSKAPGTRQKKAKER